MSPVDWIATVLMGAGTLSVLIGIICFLRLPDFYARLHATGVIETLGALLIIAGLMVHLGWSAASAKLLLLLLFMLVMNPASTHALAQAALHGGMRPPESAR